MVIGLLTGHGRLNKDMYNIGLTEDTACTHWQEKEEALVQVLSHCDELGSSLAGQGFDYWIQETPELTVK